MTSAQARLNAQCFGALQIISQDEDLMRKAVRALQRIVDKVKPAEDPTLMTKEEFFRRVDKAREDYEKGNYYEMLPGESLEAFLDRIG
ncbi:MAG: hypothetical protein K5945_02670 [Bacteroidaceae bacterium]|nr:hypothetical protein [Bacteroidaceae bacterium]